MARKTVVVGAGVIGTAIALELRASGRDVVLIERDQPGRGTSFGNMASIAVSEFMPSSRPSVWRQIPGWLMDPEGPVAVRPSHMPKLVPWFWRFLKSSSPTVLRKLEAAGAALCKRSLADTQAMLKRIRAETLITETGCLALYTNEAEFAADRDHIALLDQYGFDYEVLSSEAMRVREPALSERIGKAVLLPDNRSLKDPYRYVTLMADHFVALGGVIERAEVTAINRSAGVTGVTLSDGRSMAADDVVLCAGVYTASLARALGEPVPLETERGYHTQIMAPGISMSHAIIWPARAFMVTPTAGGIRVGGTVEMAPLSAPPNYARAKITVRRAREALPNLKCEDFTEWMGNRPALPDTVPIISASAKTSGLYYATGHGHLGLTHAATTARIMCDLVHSRKPEIDVQPFRVDRF